MKISKWPQSKHAGALNRNQTRHFSYISLILVYNLDQYPEDTLFRYGLDQVDFMLWDSIPLRELNTNALLYNLNPRLANHKSFTPKKASRNGYGQNF